MNGLIEKYNLEDYDKDATYATQQYSDKNASGQDVDEVKAGKEAGSEQYEGKALDTFVSEKSEDDTVVRLLEAATSQLGVPYVWGGTEWNKGLDCSGFVQGVYKNALGIDIPRVTTDQERVGQEVPLKADALQPGDLLFFGARGATTHVAMYIGNGYFINAPQPGETVSIANMKDWMPDFAKRIVSSHDKTDEEKSQEDKIANDKINQRLSGVVEK